MPRTTSSLCHISLSHYHIALGSFVRCGSFILCAERCGKILQLKICPSVYDDKRYDAYQHYIFGMVYKKNYVRSNALKLASQNCHSDVLSITMIKDVSVYE
jgi:hypothetical protein